MFRNDKDVIKDLTSMLMKMNALEKIIVFYHWIILTKLVSTLGLSIAVIALSFVQLENSSISKANLFSIGAIVAACITFVYQVKRLIVENEYFLLEFPRLFPLSWAIYGTVIYVSGTTPLLIMLYILGVLNLIRMEFPVGNNGVLRV